MINGSWDVSSNTNWIKSENWIKLPITKKISTKSIAIFRVVIVNGILERIVLPVIADDVPDKKRTVARKIIRI